MFIPVKCEKPKPFKPLSEQRFFRSLKKILKSLNIYTSEKAGGAAILYVTRHLIIS